MPYPRLDAKRLAVFPLAERNSLTRIEALAAEAETPRPEVAGGLADQVRKVVDRIDSARKNGAAVMLTYGAHLVKNGGGVLLIRAIERGLLSHLATAVSYITVDPNNGEEG